MDQIKIGNKIKELRKKNNLTQKELADKYNVSYQAVSKWENGKNLPDIMLLKQMCIDFDITIEELLDGNIINGTRKNNRKKTILICGLSVLFLILLILLILFLNNKNSSNFEFKKITSSCNNFKIYGSIAYNENTASIYISNIIYCGGEDKEKYKKIECDLYEVHGDSKTKITSCNFNKYSSVTLEEYLKNISLNIDNYKRVCKNHNDESLYLEINATDNSDKTTSYKIPLLLAENCNDK